MQIFKELQKQNYDIDFLHNQLQISNKKLTQHIKQIKNSKNLADFLNKGFFDYKYTSKEFLLKLAKIYSLDKEKLEKEIQEAEKIIEKLNKLRKCYLKAISDYKPTSFISAMGIASLLTVQIKPEKLLNANEKDILKYISNKIKSHCKYVSKRYNRIKIKGYLFNCLNKTYYFDTNGNLKAEDE